MTKITSIDALIDRIKEAYPNKDLIRVRELMEQGSYSGVYESLRHPRFSREEFSAERILALVDDGGRLIPEKFTALMAEATEEAATQAREALRVQLEEDFLESYEFEPARWD